MRRFFLRIIVSGKLTSHIPKSRKLPGMGLPACLIKNAQALLSPQSASTPIRGAEKPGCVSAHCPNSSLSHPVKPIREVLPPGVGQTFNRQHPSNPFPLPRPLDQSLHGIANGYGMGIGTELANAITSLN